MYRRLVHAFLVCAILGCAAGSTPTHGAEPPNVVLIVADDLGGMDLGCYGSTYHRTPQLDALAAASLRCTQAYAGSVVCSPTRAALLTGLHPARLQITDWLPGRGDRPDQRLLQGPLVQQLPLECLTLADRLRAAGYATAHVGKWHLGGPGYGPLEQGFDLNVGGTASGSPPNYFAPFARGDRLMPGLESAPEGAYLTDALTDVAVEFIRAKHQQRFFLYLPHYAVHTPLQAPEDVVAQFPAWDGTPHGRQENPIYAAMLARLDDSVGRVLAALEEAGVRENTLVIFTSDNGGLATREGPHTPSTNNAPLREGKGWLYEGGLRVPLLLSWPGRIAPGVSDTPVGALDLLPTVLEMTGQPAADEADGISLAGLTSRNEPLATRTLYWHYPHYSNQRGRPGGALRSGDWKFIEFYETGRQELYDLANDPGESRNIAAEQPEVLARLAAEFAAWRESLEIAPLAPNPDYRPNPPDDDGQIVLHARSADVFGAMLRYEPLAHKDTLGYWVNADDWARWEFTVEKPGTYAVEGLIGCGTGSGGSTVVFRCGTQELTLQVPETGGFQAFEPLPLGKLAFDEPGRYTLEVRAVEKPGVAVMDIRQVTLRPQGE